MDYYFGPHVDVKNITSKPKLKNIKKWRYSLEIPFKDRDSDGPVAYVILKNPSQAGIKMGGQYKSDKTVNKVCIYFYCRQYSKVVILNLASRYGTNLEELEYDSFDYLISPTKDKNGNKNDKEIERQLNEFREDKDIIVVGWGTPNSIRGENRKYLYDNRINQIESIINKFSQKIYQYPSDTDYPIHPATNNEWNDWVNLVLYP